MGDDSIPTTTQLASHLHVLTANLDNARLLPAGNPVFEAGRTVEIRELPRD